MQHRIETYIDLFINNVPLIDVRAPIEYEHGSFPNAKNLPIMDNQQRKLLALAINSMANSRPLKKATNLSRGKFAKHVLHLGLSLPIKIPMDPYIVFVEACVHRLHGNGCMNQVLIFQV